MGPPPRLSPPCARPPLSVVDRCFAGDVPCTGSAAPTLPVARDAAPDFQVMTVAATTPRHLAGARRRTRRLRCPASPRVAAAPPERCGFRDARATAADAESESLGMVRRNVAARHGVGWQKHGEHTGSRGSDLSVVTTEVCKFTSLNALCVNEHVRGARAGSHESAPQAAQTHHATRRLLHGQRQRGPHAFVDGGGAGRACAMRPQAGRGGRSPPAPAPPGPRGAGRA